MPFYLDYHEGKQIANAYIKCHYMPYEHNLFCHHSSLLFRPHNFSIDHGADHL